jgi:hypothetical protein
MLPYVFNRKCVMIFCNLNFVVVQEIEMLEAGRVSITGSSDEGKCIFKYKLPTPLRQD